MLQELKLPLTNQFKHPVFVVGTSRAGTTLLARILSLHPKMVSPGEPHFFEEIWPGKESEVRDMRSDEFRLAARRVYDALVIHRFEASQQKIQSSFNIDDLQDKAQRLGGD